MRRCIAALTVVSFDLMSRCSSDQKTGLGFTCASGIPSEVCNQDSLEIEALATPFFAAVAAPAPSLRLSHPFAIDEASIKVLGGSESLELLFRSKDAGAANLFRENLMSLAELGTAKLNVSVKDPFQPQCGIEKCRVRFAFWEASNRFFYRSPR